MASREISNCLGERGAGRQSPGLRGWLEKGCPGRRSGFALVSFADRADSRVVYTRKSPGERQ